MTKKHHYRDFILKELERRQRKNPSYSLRAFSRDLEVPCSRLSEILNGKVGLSEGRAVSLATKLNLSPSERDFFVDLALSEHARSAVLRDMALQRVKSREEAFEKIGEEQFAVISDWYHLAITQVLQLKDFEGTIENIAQRLGLTPEITERALERLEHLKLVQKTENGLWTSSDEKYSSSYGGSSEAARNYFMQMQNKAVEAMSPDNKRR